MLILNDFSQADFDDLIAWIPTEEMLITIAGTDWQFPLNDAQLADYLQDPKMYRFTITDQNAMKLGHAALVIMGDNSYKIDRLIIGSPAARGQGLGEKTIRLLLEYAFEKLNAVSVVLNVFDWNHAAIRCYQKCGFRLNPGLSKDFKSGHEIWTAVNMLVLKSDWKQASV